MLQPRPRPTPQISRAVLSMWIWMALNGLCFFICVVLLILSLSSGEPTINPATFVGEMLIDNVAPIILFFVLLMLLFAGGVTINILTAISLPKRTGGMVTFARVCCWICLGLSGVVLLVLVMLILRAGRSVYPMQELKFELPALLAPLCFGVGAFLTERALKAAVQTFSAAAPTGAFPVQQSPIAPVAPKSAAKVPAAVAAVSAVATPPKPAAKRPGPPPPPPSRR